MDHRQHIKVLPIIPVERWTIHNTSRWTTIPRIPGERWTIHNTSRWIVQNTCRALDDPHHVSAECWTIDKQVKVDYPKYLESVGPSTTHQGGLPRIPVEHWTIYNTSEWIIQNTSVGPSTARQGRLPIIPGERWTILNTSRWTTHNTWRALDHSQHVEPQTAHSVRVRASLFVNTLRSGSKRERGRKIQTPAPKNSPICLLPSPPPLRPLLSSRSTPPPPPPPLRHPP